MRTNRSKSRFSEEETCLSEIDRKLQAVNSLLSPGPRNTRTGRRKGAWTSQDDIIIVSPDDDDEDDDDDDVSVVSPHQLTAQDSSYSSSVREISLKVRCRTDVHKIPVLTVRHQRHLRRRVCLTSPVAAVNVNLAFVSDVVCSRRL